MIFLFRSHRDFHNELFTAVTYPRFYLICNFFLGPLSVGVLPLPVSLGSPFTPPAVMTTYNRQDPQPVLPTIRVLRVLPLIFRTQPHRILPVDPLQGLPEQLLREPVQPRVHLR